MPICDSESKKILIVDDDSSVRYSLKRILASKGFTVLEAIDAQSAMMIFDTDSPDMVITDINMPGLSGIEFVEKLTHKLNGNTPPIAFMSGRATNQELIPQGSEFFCKPFDVAKLLKCIYALTSSCEA